MHIGSIVVDSVVDGEMLCPPEFIYPQVDPAEFDAYRESLDPITGAFIVTVGAFLIRLDDRVVLIDAGLGPKPIYPMTGGALRSALIARGVKPTDVTDIIFTHLHFDHIGWISHNGHPVFPNATLHCDKRDWDFFVASNREIPEWESMATTPETDAAPVKFAPVQAQVQFWEGDAEIMPGIRTIDAPGHTCGTVVFELSSDGERGLILGDLIHTEPELIHAWPFLVADDMDQALASTRKIRDLLAREGVPCVGSHFAGMRWGKVVANGESYRWEELTDQ